MSAITAKARRKMKKYAVLTREPRCFLGSFDFSWEQRKVGDLLIERNQQAPMSDEYPLMAFIANEGVAPKGERYDRSALVTDTVNKLYKKTEKGDFIYSSNNLETGSIGLNKYGKACISPVYSIFEPTGIADSDFLGRRLVRKDFINAMVKWRQGVIYGQWRIHESDFLKIEIPVPSVEEQRKIGAYLDQLDNLITLHQRKCVFLFSFFRACISMNFTASTFSWEQRKFSEITFLSGEKNRENLPLESYSITNESGFVPQDEKFENGGTMREADKRMYYIVSPNSFAYNPARINVGSIGYQNTEKNVIVSSLYEIFKTSDDVDDRLLWHWFKSPDFQKLIWQLQEGGVRLYFYYDKLCMGEVSLPSLEEQRKIGKFFDTLDNLITLHQRECISFTGSAGRLILTANKKRTASSWEQRKLGELVDVCSGRDYKHLSEGTIPVYGTGGYMLSVNDALSYDRDAIGIGRKGTIDRPYILKAPFWTVDTLFYAIPREKADLNFAFDIFQNIDWKKKDESTGVPSLSKTAINDIDVLAPKHGEQQTIGQFFAAIDHLITLHQRKPFLMKWRTSDANRNQTNRLVL